MSRSCTFFFSFFVIFFFTFFTYAMNGRTTYQGKIIKPDGYPLEATSVQFRFTVLDPTAACVLYVEDYSNVNMSGSGGLISLTLGLGVRSFPASGTLTFAQTFDNSIPMFNCQNPGAYNPVPADNRRIVMQFNDGNGWQTLPSMAINAVPYAMYATKSNDSLKLNNKADTSFVEYSTLSGLGCAANQALHFNGVSFTCLNVGGSYTVTTSDVTTALGYTPTNAASFTALSSATSTSFTTVTNNINSVSSSVSSLAASTAASLSAITSSQWSDVVSGISYSSGNVGIGTTTPLTKLSVSGGVQISMESTSCAVSYAGTLRYNAGNVEFCNGSAWNAFGVSGAGLQSLNGSTSGTQTFAFATGGTSPNFSTANGVHTLNIPYASVGTTTTGLISNADYQNFSNKITSSAASIAQVLGYTPASATTLTNYLAKANNLSDLTSSATARTNLGLGTLATASTLDLGSASATGTIADARLANQAGVTSGTPYTKVTVDGKGRVTTGAQLASGDVTTALGYTPASASAATQWSTSGTTINYTNGNVGIGTTNPTLNLSLDGNSNKTMGTVRQTTTSPGKSLTVQVGGVISGGNNYPGGDLILKSGIATGTGDSSISFFTSTASGTGTADNIPTQKMAITGSGNVGIGTATPNVKLAVGGSLYSTSANQIHIVNTGAFSTFALGEDSNNYGSMYWSDIGNYISMDTKSGGTTYNNTLVAKDGKVGVGTTNPTAKLTVSGSVVTPTNEITSGGTVNLALSNTHYLSSVGGATITLSNMVNGGVYTIIVADTTPRTYTFSGCANSYFSPANEDTESGTQSIYGITTVYVGSVWRCYITWSTGFQ